MITIIGGGPIGCYTASLLSKNNDVQLIEENEEVGIPIQCTGILSDTIHKIVKLKKSFIANKIYQAKIFAPNNNYVKIKFKRPNIIVYRNLFDHHFRDLAIKNGAKIKYAYRYIGKNTFQNLHTKRKSNFKQNILVGADGPLSKVSTANGLGKRKYLQGVQALIKKKNDNSVEFFPHIGTYAWSVPQDETILRIGVAAKKDAMKVFKEFSKRYKGKMLGWQGGLIPLYQPNMSACTKNVYLVGDAAAQIKNTTGGGLIPGLMCAEELDKAINSKSDYDKLWKKRVSKKLWAHYMVRNVLNKFSNKDWNSLVQSAKEDFKDILATESRDEPIKVLSKVLLRKPSLIMHARKLFGV